MKDLSILIRSYNETLFQVNRCLNSILKLKDIEYSEIIVFNDCGSDVTLNSIKNFIDNNNLNIRLIESNTHYGAGIALKNLYKAASRKYIIFCDLDDEYVIDDGLYTAINKLKKEACDYIQCDTGVYRLHQMTIFKKEKIKEELFLGFNYRNDEYMCYIYNYLYGIHYPLQFYKWHYETGGIHSYATNSENLYLWHLYSMLLNKKVTVNFVCDELENFTPKDGIIYCNFIQLLNTNLFNV